MLRSGDGIVAGVLTLLSIGVVMVASAGMGVGGDDAVTLRSILLSKPMAFLAVAVALLLSVRALPVDRLATSPAILRSIPLLLPLVLLLLAAVYAPGTGVETKGAARWVALPGGLTMQPSELAKWTMPLLLAWYCSRRAGVMDQFLHGLLPPAIVLGAVSAIVTLEDLGTGVLILAAGVVVLLAGGARPGHFLAFTPPALLGLGAAVVFQPYRLRRLTTFFDPFADPDGAGYHIIQSLVAIAGGGPFGRGLGFGVQKFGYLPEDRTDFLFAIVCEELGLAGAVLVVALYGGIVLAALDIVRRQRQPILKLAGIGITATFGLQALINLAVVTGLAPTKGIALPLLSAGGTGWILTAAALGLLAACDRAARVPEASPATDPATKALAA